MTVAAPSTMEDRVVDELVGQHVSLVSLVVRLVVAALLGALLGWDRERQDKPAGLRTHMLVALGSATFILLAYEVAPDLTNGSARFDPTRVLQGVVGGIGFLGAGSIIQARGRVSGVTTAASVWMAGALGAAAGIGAHVVALVAAALAILILSVLGRLESRLKPHDREQPKPGAEDAGPSAASKGRGGQALG
jgi:putative Mg2+ transporter-C (MgtC) family protein